MKVLMIHVGNELNSYDKAKPDFYLHRKSLLDGSLKPFLKHDIVNADTLMQSIIAEGVEIEYGHFTNRKSLKSMIIAGRKIRNICKEKRPNLVHVLWGTTTALMCVLFSPVPVVVSFSGSDLLGNVDSSGKKNKSGLVSSFLSQIAAVLATRIIIKSQHMKEELWAISRKKATVIPNGLRLEIFFPMDRSECRRLLKWKEEAKYVLFFDGGGALVKDRPLAEKVFALVRNSVADCTLKIMIGINHDTLPLYYNAADVLLITSFHEGSNNSLKEARACNLPVVSVNCGDAKERLNGVENSYVIHSRRPEEIAEKVIWVLQANKRSDGTKLSDEVSLETVARRVINVYKEAVAR